MKNIFAKFICASFALLFMLTSCGDGSDSHSNLPLMALYAKLQEQKAASSEPVVLGTSNTVYSVSSGFSNVTTKALGKIGLKTSDDATKIPEIFVVKASDIGSMSVQQRRLLLESIIADKPVIIDKPTAKTSAILADTILGESANYKTDVRDRYMADQNSFDELLQQLANSYSQAASPDEESYDAVCIRDMHLYFVHDVSKEINAPVSLKKDEKEFMEDKKIDGEGKEEGAKEQEVFKEAPLDVAALEDRAAELLSAWLKKSMEELYNVPGKMKAFESTEARTGSSDIGKYKDAQSVIHSFAAITNFDSSASHYDGRYNNKSELVEVEIYVWAGCNIETQVDHYLIQNSVTCHNQDLGYKKEWGNKYIGPWLDEVRISTWIDENKQTILNSQCSPQTSVGSTSFTSGTSVNIGGNVGVNGSGPTAGVSGGVTFSNTTTRSIPDVKVEFKKTADNDTEWKFMTKGASCDWSGLVTKGYDPCEVSYKQMTVDTFSYITIPSGSGYGDQNGCFKLKSYVRVWQAYLTGWLSGFLNSTLNYSTRYDDSKKIFYDVFNRPCNAKANYFMMFEPPESFSPSDIQILETALKDKVSDWKGSVPYYAVGENNLNTAAKTYFSKVKTAVNNNKNSLKAYGFKGKFKFMIKHEQSGNEIDSFEVEF